MAVYHLFSKRKKRSEAKESLEYVYDSMPDVLKVQIVHIWNDALGSEQDYSEKNVHKTYKFIVETLCRELGLFELGEVKDPDNRNYRSELISFFLQDEHIDNLLDTIELSFEMISKVASDTAYLQRVYASDLAAAAVEELNARFLEHSLGYAFTQGKIVKLVPSIKKVADPYVEPKIEVKAAPEKAPVAEAEPLPEPESSQLELEALQPEPEPLQLEPEPLQPEYIADNEILTVTHEVNSAHYGDSGMNLDSNSGNYFQPDPYPQ